MMELYKLHGCTGNRPSSDQSEASNGRLELWEIEHIPQVNVSLIG